MSDRPPITHVAIRFDGRLWSLPRPYRHHDIIRMIVELGAASRVDAMGDDQGFLDASGRYLRRGPALVSAQMNGQIIEGRGQHPQLYSEDVW